MKKLDRHQNPVLDDLKLWIQREVGGTEALLDQLSSGKQILDENDSLNPKFFKQKLCSIGCTMDAATYLADYIRGKNGNCITPDSIREAVGASLVPPTAKPRPCQNRSFAKPAWNDRCALELQKQNSLNEVMPKRQRSCFSEAREDRHLLNSPHVQTEIGLSRALARSYTSPGDLSEQRFKLTNSTTSYAALTSPGAATASPINLSPSSAPSTPYQYQPRNQPDVASPVFRAKEASSAASWDGVAAQTQSMRSLVAAQNRSILTKSVDIAKLTADSKRSNDAATAVTDQVAASLEEDEEASF
jgi:hypothetical protein